MRRRSSRYVVIGASGIKTYVHDAKYAHQKARETVRETGLPAYVFAQVAKWTTVMKRTAR